MLMKILITLLCIFFLACHQGQMTSFPPGGLNYPTDIATGDSSFYIYQYKDSLSIEDSLEAADYGRYFLHGYDEPNLSIKPQEELVFRFTCEISNSYPIVINLKMNQLIVKERVKGWLYPVFDNERLSKSEQKQLQYSELYFRLSGEKKKIDLKRRPYLDSLIKIYPKLTDVSAYQELKNKAALKAPEKLQYSIKIVPISPEKFNQLVSLINESGFWTMRKESWCEFPPNDGSYFKLEANTASHYKIVGSPSCENDNRKFTLACQEIINAAGMTKQLPLIWDGKTSTIYDSIKIPDVKIRQPN